MEVSMEMERDAVPPDPRKVKKVRDLPKFDLSGLEARLKSIFNYNEDKATKTSGTSTGTAPPSGAARKLHFLTPLFVTKIAVPAFFFTLVATWCLGMFVVMPRLLEHDPDSLYCHRWIMCVLLTELMGHWLCLRYVDSSYFKFLRNKWKARVNNRAPLQPASSSSVISVDDGVSAGHMKGNTARSDGADSNPLLAGNLQKPHLYNHSDTGGQVQTHDSLSSFPDLDHGAPRPPWKPAFRPNTSQMSYPYWSWVPCYVCEVVRPPRCHHCPVCQACVLKRDHHCYFSGTCVGWRNQRYFVTFALWAFTGCCYGTLNSYHYFYSDLWPAMAWFDLLFPVTVARWITGYVPGMLALYVTVQTLLFYFMLLTFGFINEHVMLMWRGKTSFEVASLKKNLELRDTRTFPARIRPRGQKNTSERFAPDLTRALTTAYILFSSANQGRDGTLVAAEHLAAPALATGC